MEDFVAALGDGEKETVSAEHSTSRQEPVVGIGSGDTSDSKSEEEESNPVYNRVFIPNQSFDGADASKQFSILSYNVLADCHLFRNDYSFTKEDYLKPDYRLNKLVEEIRFLDADIACLQEVDPGFFQDQLMPSMKSLGYEGFHKKRTENFYDEGEATFYKTARFTLVGVTQHRVADLVEKEFVEGMDPTIQTAVRQYMDRADVLVVAKLKCNYSGQEVTVGNIHVTWGEMKVPDVQALQIACAIKEVVNKAGSEAHPHIICGDFNSEPYSSGYCMAKDGYLSDEETINKLQQLKNIQLPDERMESLVNCLSSGFRHTSSSLKSVYFQTQGAEPDITSYNRGMCACVDYIFYSSSSLDAVGVLQTAPKDRIMETGGTPNCYFPSDHVSLKAVFSFK